MEMKDSQTKKKVDDWSKEDPKGWSRWDRQSWQHGNGDPPDMPDNDSKKK